MKIKTITLAFTLAIGFLTSARSQTINVEQPYRQTDLFVSIGNADDSRPSDISTDIGTFINTNVGPAHVAGTSYWGGFASADAMVMQNSTISLSPSQTSLTITGSMSNLVHYTAAAIDPDTGHYGGASAYARSIFGVRIVTDSPFLFTLNVTTTHAGSTDASSIYDVGTVASYVSLAPGGNAQVFFAEYGEQGQLGSPSFHVAASESGTFSQILPAGSYDLNATVEDNRDGNGSGGPSISDVGNRSANFTLTVSPAPTNQPLIILSYEHADGTNNTITAQGTPLDPFVLQIKSALEATNDWMDVQTNTADAAGLMTFAYTTPATNSAMFFRVRTR